MTLADAVSLALRSNRNITIAYLNRVIQKYDLQIAEAEFLPNIRMDIAAGGTYTDAYATLLGSKSTTISESLEAGAILSATQKLSTGARIAFGWENQSKDLRRKTDGALASSSMTPSRWDITFSQPLLKGSSLPISRVS